MPLLRRKEDSKAFSVDQEKFSTQRCVTYVLLVQFAATAANVFYNNDQSERSMMLQAIISLATFAVGYWLGASKQGQDTAQAMNRIAESVPSAAPAAVPPVTPDLANAHDGIVPAAEATKKDGQ